MKARVLFFFMCCASLAAIACANDDETPEGVAGRGGESSAVAGGGGDSSGEAEAAGRGGAPTEADLMSACLRSCSMENENVRFILALYPLDEMGNPICEPGDEIQHGRLLGEGGAAGVATIPTDPQCFDFCESQRELWDCWKDALPAYDCSVDMLLFCAADGDFYTHDCSEFNRANGCSGSG